MKHLDLFSGIGGFALAAKWAAIETIAFCETDKLCSQILKKHWPDIINHGDIKKFNPVDMNADIITGGFPCQPFSQAGNKKGHQDDRYLWPEFFRIIKTIKPAWVLAENVTGIIDIAIDNILSDLENENYETATFIIPACAIKAPHKRERVWIIAYFDRLRSYDRFNCEQERYLQKNKNGNLEKIQQKWSQLIPDTWATFTIRDWIQYNARIGRRNNGIPSRLDKDRIKTLGNSIVPQVVYPILELIKDLHHLSLISI